MRTHFIKHVRECEACKSEPYIVCGEGVRLWRGDNTEMEAVNEYIQLCRLQAKALREYSDIVEKQLDAIQDWPEVVGG